MVNRDIVAARLSDLSDRVSRVRKHCPSDSSALATNRDALDLISFNLMLAVQACADIASHIISDEKWAVAATLGEGFQRLAEHAVISPATAASLGRAVGLRNVVAHGYSGVDPALVYSAATTGIGDLDRFAREVAAWLAKASP